MSFAVATTNQVLSRLSGHRDTGSADLGNYFTARTPTPGTGIVCATSVNTFVETTPAFVLYNAGPYNVYPMSLRTHVTVIGTNAAPVVDLWTVTADVGNRYASGGTQLTVQNTNLNVTPNSGAFVFVGAVTATAATPRRRVLAHLTAKFDDDADGGIEIVHDTMNINWGDTFTGSAYPINARTTSPSYNSFGLPPCVIGPNCSLVLVRWCAAQSTGTTLEYQFSWIEK